MQFSYYAPKLTAPTMESLQEYAHKRFDKLSRFISENKELQVRIAVKKEKHLFVLSVEINTHKPIVIQVEDVNLYAAVDKASAVMKKVVSKRK